MSGEEPGGRTGLDASDRDHSDAAEELQFDHAEYEGPRAALACAVCQQPIAGPYFQAGASSFCPACRDLVELTQARKPGLSGFLSAAFLGSLAAAAGSLLYYGIAALTGYNFGLIAIVVGVFVGRAVRRGSGGRGGLSFQLLALFLTYASIVSTYIPYIVAGLAASADKKPGAASTAKPAAVDPATAGKDLARPSKADPSVGRALVSFGVGLALLFGIAFAAPFLSLGEGVNGWIGLIIIGIGLLEAWKANAWIEIDFQGPFELRPADGAGSTATD